MTRSVRVRPEAERDVETAFAWYEEQRPGLGREFLHELDVVYKRIANFPFLYAELYRGSRRARMRRFRPVRNARMRSFCPDWRRGRRPRAEEASKQAGALCSRRGMPTRYLDLHR